MRRVKLCVLMTACMLACLGGAARAGGRPNLSGSWELDGGRSSFGDYAGPLSKAKTKLEIRHKEPEVRIVWTLSRGDWGLSQLALLFSDGRGEETASLLDAEGMLAETTCMSGGGGGRQVKSKTVWEGNKLVTRTSEQLQLASGPAEVDVLDEWELSKDKQSLVQLTRLTPKDAAAGVAAREFKRVYRRVK
ncbi:MAG: hypothetical protein JOZ96_05430 [Acidobacteria bacterium]|nr:hypothetical protein [Acidobacteriota bacterium]